MKKASRYVKMLLLASSLLAGTSCQQAQEKEHLLLDISAIAHKSPDEVTAILGQPDSSYFQKRGLNRVPVHLYNPHHIEIFYTSGKASEIVVNSPKPLPYHPKALASFNIEPVNPNQANDKASLKWSNIPGFRYITFFSHQVQADTVSEFRIFFNLAKEENN